MKFYCDQCNAQYMIADEKVGDRGVKVRCKRCENVIVIRPTAEVGSDEETVYPPPPGNEEETNYPTSDGDLASASGDQDEDLSLDDDDGIDGLGEALTGDTAIAASPYGSDPLIDEDVGSGGNGRRDEEFDDASGLAVTSGDVAQQASAMLAAEGDVLDNELAGAFDTVFGETSDPFAAVPSVESTDHSRRETRFYSNNELVRVEEERAAAVQMPPLDDDISLPGPAHLEMPGGGNGSGRTPFSSLTDQLHADHDEEPGPDEPAGFDTVKLWYVAIDDDQAGPVSVADLAEYWDQGQVDGDSLVWQSGLPDWMPVRDVLDLRDLVQAKTAAAPPRTAIEQPRGLAGLADFDEGIGAGPAEDGGLPFEASDDPFALAGGEDMPPPDMAGSGTWRPRGMTEIYQAASLAESSAMQPIPEDAPEEEDEEVNWQPGAAAALASLVEQEIDVIKQAPSYGDSMPIAEDSDVSGKPLPPIDELLSTRPIRLQEPVSPYAEDPFSQQISSHSTDDINIEQIAGQSSMVLKRPSYISAPKREMNWPLILGAGGGGLALIGLFVVVLVLLLREPAPAVVVQAPTNPVTGTPTTGGPSTGSPQNPTNPAGVTPGTGTGTTTGAAATDPAAAGGTDVTKPDPGASADPRPGNNPAETGDDGRKGPSTRKPSGNSSSTKGPRKVEPRTDPKPDPKPDPQSDPEPVRTPTKRSGSCDPILYPDGNCPTGDAALPPSRSNGKKATLSKTDILMTVKKNLGDVKQCSAEQAKRNPRLATGTLKMQWYIRPDGRTKNVSVLDSKFKGTYVGGCVQDAIAKWKFPTFDGDDVGPIKFPFPL